MLKFSLRPPLAAMALGWLVVSAHGAAWPQGNFENSDYGYRLVVQGKQAILYDFVNAHCQLHLRLPVSKLTAWVGRPIANEVSGAPLTAKVGITNYQWQRIEKLPDSCKPNNKSATKSRSEQSLEIIQQTLQRYGLPGSERLLDGDFIAQALTEKSANKQAKQLWQALSTQVQRTNDPHFALRSDDQEVSGKSSRLLAYEQNTGRALVPIIKGLQPYLASANLVLQGGVKRQGKRMLYGVIEPGIGYLTIGTMGALGATTTIDAGTEPHQQEAALQLDAVLQSLQQDTGGLRGLVLDLRFNQGGFDAVAMELASRFTSGERHVFSKRAALATSDQKILLQASNNRRFEGPVAMLIGPATVSAGEIAALAISSLPNVRSFGIDATQGAFSDAIEKALPIGWQFTFSAEIYTDVEGQIVEKIGVQPDQLIIANRPMDDYAIYGQEIVAARDWIRTQVSGAH